MIFISYRHESELYSQRVRGLAERLRERLSLSGIEVSFDHFLLDAKPGGPSEGWPKWCSKQVRESTRVVMIVSPGWADCFNDKESQDAGAGVACEAHVIWQELYDAHWKSDKFRVCLLDSDYKACIPSALSGFHKFVSPKDDERLLAWLAGDPEAPMRTGTLRVRENALWMLCQIDRSHQASELSAAWAEHLQQRNKRPLVCFIHGATDQCHHEFLKRLEEELLPTLPNLLRPDAAVLPLTIEWPKDFSNQADFKDRLRWNLGKDLLKNQNAELTHVHLRLTGNPGTVVVSTQFLSSYWERKGPTAMAAFLEFWSGCPDLMSSPGLLVLICVTYRADAGFLRRLFGDQSIKALRRYINNELTTLDQSRVTVKPLKELGDIEEGEALTWVDVIAKRLGDQAAEIRTRINELYANTKSIPMERLVREIKPCFPR